MRHFDLIFRPVLALPYSDAPYRLVPAPAIHPAATPLFAFIPHATLLSPYSQVFFDKFIQNSPSHSSLRHNLPH